ncbi:MAG: zeta toxin family protein [Candidatus Delongbacteria bacterium]|nr:zeta toxin family protein [Candidatus Delongbacteria bacterium]
MKKIYIISGANGAGKTTASYTVLPEILECKEYVNADEIAKGLSPFNPDSVNIQAGKLMLNRINKLLDDGHNFAFETTLASKSFLKYLDKAHEKGYTSVLVFLWLNSQDLAIERVQSRVKEGGHNIPKDVIKRRYTRGLKNFFNIYSKAVDSWMFINNSGNPYKIIAEGSEKNETVYDDKIWEELNGKYNYSGRYSERK